MFIVVLITVSLFQFSSMKYFFVFCVSVLTVKETEVTNEGFGMLESN